MTNKSNCKLCTLKKTKSECLISKENDNNNNNNCFKSYNKTRHKCYHNFNSSKRHSDILSMENQELLPLGAPRMHNNYAFNNEESNSDTFEQINSLSFRILIFLMIHFGFIITTTIFFCYLEEIKSQYAIRSIINKYIDKNAKFIIYFVYFLIFLFFLLMVSISKLKMQLPFQYLIFLIYTLIMSLFYTYLTMFHVTSILIEFFSIILLSLILLSIYCCCQRKYTLINVPYLPYVYSYLSILIFLFIFYLFKISLSVNGFRNVPSITGYSFLTNQEPIIEFVFNIVIAFFYIFYIIFDLQFILNNYSNDYGCNSLTCALNLLTKDVIQLIFLFNSFILNSIINK